MVSRAMGLLPDKEDERDLAFKEISKKLLSIRRVVSLPKAVDLRNLMSPIRNQGNLNACTGFALACGLRESIDIEHFRDPFVPLSPLFLYYQTRKYVGTVDEDEGATLRDTIKTAAKVGICPETLWPYVESNVFVEPTQAALSDSSRFQVHKYYRVRGKDEVCQSLAAANPVVCGISVYESFQSETVARTGVVPLPKPKSEQDLGGHAILIVGYDSDDQIFVCRNSWGEEWGMNGYFTLPFDYFAPRRQLVGDMWTATC